MKLEPPGTVWVVTTQTSIYRIDTVALQAVRGARPAGDRTTDLRPGRDDAPVVVQRQLFTDRAALDLTEVPEPVVGQRMRMRIRVADEFLDDASKGKPTDILTTEVVSVEQVAALPGQ